MPREQGRKMVAQNKKARHDYSIEDVYEAGMVLTGTVVTSLRAGRASLVGGYATLYDGEICLGGFGEVRVRSGERWPTWLEVRSSQPVLACLASQYAGWSLAASKEETGGKKFFALGSGPARALAGKSGLAGCNAVLTVFRRGNCRMTLQEMSKCA